MTRTTLHHTYLQFPLDFGWIPPGLLNSSMGTGARHLFFLLACGSACAQCCVPFSDCVVIHVPYSRTVAVC